VSCDLTPSALHGYFDGELSAASTVEFKRHLEHCSHCVAELDACDSVRDSLRRSHLYEHAPPLLRQKIRTDLRPKARMPAVLRPQRWHWLAAATAFLLVALVGWRINSGPRGDDYQAEVAEIVDAHMRSLQPGRMTVIASNDEHAVKAWFDGKLKFAFPVRGLTNDGFPLQGGRLDAVEGRLVAALVYSRREHLVNVFIWPTREQDASPRAGSRQGYQWIDWRKGEIEFCAVSNAPTSDLQQLQRLLTN
jgi:mycothiol system anti-sigma-R factor